MKGHMKRGEPRNRIEQNMPAQSLGGKDRKRILLVEDDDSVRRALQLLLFSHGYDVRAYPSGAGLAQDPEALCSDGLVADLLIPGGDAVALLKELRGAGWAGPAVLISGHLTEAWAEQALTSGYAATFAKPIGDAVLISCLAGLVPNDHSPRPSSPLG
jgi:FixJ family two-component response regulator